MTALAASLLAPRTNVEAQAASGTAKYPRIAAIWENPGDFSSATLVGENLDLVILHFQTARHAAAVKAAARKSGRAIKTACYVYTTFTIEDGSQPWRDAFIATAPESWYLHNPYSSSRTSDRVRSKDEVLLDISNKAYQQWIGPHIVSAIRDSAPGGGIDGIFHDGASLTSNIGYYDRYWPHRPSGPPSAPGTEAALWPEWMLTFLDALRRPLTAAGIGYLIVCTTTHKFTDADWADDTPFISHVDAGFNEFFCSSYLDSYTSQLDQRNWPWWTQRLQASMTANKDYICLAGVENANDPGNRWLTYSLASFLLHTNGINGYFMWSANGLEDRARMYLQGIQTSIGTPTQGAVANPDGTYQRQFTNKLVLVNPTDKMLRGLRPYTASIA